MQLFIGVLDKENWERLLSRINIKKEVYLQIPNTTSNLEPSNLVLDFPICEMEVETTMVA
jgi:hypothetical protein